MVAPQVLLVEDQLVVRLLVTSILKSHCSIVGTVERGEMVLAAIGDLQPDVVILDISLPGQSGLEVLPIVRRDHPHTGIVMLTSHEEPECIEEAFRGGADAYVFKRHILERLWPAVSDVWRKHKGRAA